MALVATPPKNVVREPEGASAPQGLSVVLLSYNRPLLLEGALSAIEAQTMPIGEVIVVDNHSAASSEIREMIRRRPEIKLIANSMNDGFASGMNRGLAEATGGFVYLTEDDIELRPDCLARLFAAWQRLGEDTLISPILIDSESGRTQYAGGEIDPATLHLRVWQESRSASNPYPTLFLGGASIFGRRDTVDRLGGFRDDFFVYWEDVEFSLRMPAAGITGYIVPDAVGVHATPPHRSSATVLYHKNKNYLGLTILHGRRSAIIAAVWRLARDAAGALRCGRWRAAEAFLRAGGWTAVHAVRLRGDRHRLRAGLNCWNGTKCAARKEEV